MARRIFSLCVIGFDSRLFFSAAVLSFVRQNVSSIFDVGDLFCWRASFISALGEARLQSRRALLDERNSLEERVAERTREMTAANEKLAAQIAQREKAQVALSESESRFRSVVETATDAIVMSNADGNIIFWNRGAQEMFGYSAEEVLQQSLHQVNSRQNFKKRTPQR